MNVRYRSTSLVILFCITMLNASEIEKAVRKDVGATGVELLQDLVKDLQVKAPNAKLSYADRLLTINHGDEFNCEKEGGSLGQYRWLHSLTLQRCVAKTATVMRFNSRPKPCGCKFDLLGVLTRGDIAFN